VTAGEDAPRPQSPLAQYLGFELVEATDDLVVSRCLVRPEHNNPTGAVHGGTLIALADNAATRMANIANAKGPNAGRFMVAIDLHAVMLRNQKGGEIRAESRIVRVGSRVTVVRTVVLGAEGKPLIEVTTTHVPA